MTHADRTTELTIATWNVLAAPWASPAFYPDAMDATVLDRAGRAKLVADVIRRLGADVVCLQETTPPDLAVVRSRLDGWDHCSTANARSLWSTWSTDDVPWETNGTAVAWRADALADVTTGACELSADGNVATWLRARHVQSGARVRILSVHLDADDPVLRRAQLPIVLGHSAVGSGEVDVVAGDCNEDTIGTDLGEMCAERGFADALTVVGCTDPTHPYARPSDDYAPIARLDHILVRGATPVSGAVIDSGVWAVDVPGVRMEEHLRLTGSDHLPVVAVVRI